QGERELAQDNISLGRFQVEGIPLAPRGVPRVEVAFKADVDGMIHACATDLLTDREVRVEVVSTKHLDQTEIAFLAEQAEQSAEDDRKTRERIASAIEAQNLISAAELVLSREDSPYVDPQAQQVGHALSRLKQALEHGLDEENKALIGEMRQLLEKWPQRVARDPLASLH
ncbi:MAG: Hsp70 family protein, partial [Chloroflexi bacterium]|nr:Hsp70 family protein [Chloroflexota bacterium]